MRLWNSSKIRDYLQKKGIEVDRLNGNVLTPLQLLAINTLLDYNDDRPDKKKLADLSINTRTFTAWKADPGFQNYLAARVEKLVGNNFDEVDRALFDAARMGDLPAIKYINEFTGRYRPSTNDAVDVNYVVVKIQEILLKHLVNHPDILQNISSELSLLTTGTPVGARAIQGELV
jgi:hypothetical protein